LPGDFIHRANMVSACLLLAFSQRTPWRLKTLHQATVFVEGNLLVFGACEAAVEDGIMAGLKSRQLQT
jgi:hypothetical protein